MGISGLLPLLKSVQQPTHVKEFAGQCVAVDGYVWLHRGAIACATDLALDRPTERYVDYAMHRVRMLQHYGVKPYVVFDGAYLPSKLDTELARETARSDARAIALRLYRAGNKTQAHDYFQKSIDVTPVMAARFVAALAAANVPYVVAPYEADAQLVYLEKIGAVTAVISEDSDLLVFGCKTLLTKLGDYGDCIAIRRSRFAHCTDVNLASFTDTMFRQMAIFAGCDYTPGIPSIGLKKAHLYLNRYRTAERALRFLRTKMVIPAGFESDFVRADLTFKHQRVFCPVKQKLVMLSEPDVPLTPEMDYNIGPDVPAHIAVGVATGALHPVTKDKLDISQARTIPQFKKAQMGESITSYFKRQSTPAQASVAHATHALSDITNTFSDIAQSSPQKATKTKTDTAWIAALGHQMQTPFGLGGRDDWTKRLKVMSPGSDDAVQHSRYFTAAKNENVATDGEETHIETTDKEKTQEPTQATTQEPTQATTQEPTQAMAQGTTQEMIQEMAHETSDSSGQVMNISQDDTEENKKDNYKSADKSTEDKTEDKSTEDRGPEDKTFSLGKGQPAKRPAGLAPIFTAPTRRRGTQSFSSSALLSSNRFLQFSAPTSDGARRRSQQENARPRRPMPRSLVMRMTSVSVQPRDGVGLLDRFRCAVEDD